MSLNCELSKILLKKFGYLEKRVTYLEDKSRGQENIIVKLQTKLKTLERSTINHGQLDQEEFEEPVDIKPNLNELTRSSSQNAQLNIAKNDKKLSQKLVVQMGVRCFEKTPRLLNQSENIVERNQKFISIQCKTKSTHQKVKTRVGISSKPNRKVKKSHNCAFCLKSCKDFSQLSEHMRIHTGERPFKCEVCSKSFTQMTNLNTHSRVHTGEKPFSCSVCSKKFGTSTNVKKHLKTHTGEKPFACSVCARNFASSTAVKYHMMIHTGDKPFSCSVCSKAFGLKSSLNVHMIVAHKGTYSCSICSRRFGCNSVLKIHERTHKTGERYEYECSICKRKFLHLKNLAQHRKRSIKCKQ